MLWFAEQFDRHRARLRAVAYRMLGSLTEADDALQEAWIRSIRADSTVIDNISGWLVTLVGRVCIDMLRARTARRESLMGSTLPEPVVSTGESLDPEQASLLADSVGLALLVVLDSLEPAERLAVVLHDMFGVPFAEIAPIVERSPEATRQLASRARRRLRGTVTTPDADLALQRKVVDAFLAAARTGDFERLLTLLDPAIVLRVDPGSRPWVGPTVLAGATDVAGHITTHAIRFARLCSTALVNGAAGVLAASAEGVLAVAGVTVTGGRIVEIDLLLDPGRLAALHIATGS
ncbi:RNA polymerase subunit sigma-70 [Frankia sp. CcI49]|uniref:sigma-70 family RNA polymerase sigma factor n=1 Tax=unclassified Frankia TaxID=2632575 RepID=UPI0006CA5284|nr:MULTISPECIES: sigma-70 family RNA polymerase sigma factor [unclassified Frankia]KPM54457.1 hypothetical protein ACG83_18615 [Frankia sp. R43]ONH61776.1 RNA polymerase subunit sigma-70 [Frankia sp. CcI49]